MQMEKLPLPNPHEWITIDGAAKELGCSRRTVTRYIGAGALQLHMPRCRPGERVQGWLWYAEVAELARARQVVKGAERDTSRR